jgi:(p)ppGpp synthase/HD superfamily hydrolase
LKSTTSNAPAIELVERARAYANKCHSETNHLYDGMPYMHHLHMAESQAERFAYLLPYPDRDKVIAAVLLHDTLEDCRKTYNDLKKEMNSVEIADIVYAVTNDKGKTRKERAGKKYYRGIRKTKYASFVKLCDRIANVTHGINKRGDMVEKYRKEHHEFYKQMTSRGWFVDIIISIASWIGIPPRIQYEEMWEHLEQLLFA